MKVLKGKRAKTYVNIYLKSKCYSVLNFYSHCSYAKQKAENDIIYYMNSVGGYGYKILGGNWNTFTTGYKLEENNVIYLIIDTAWNTYKIDVLDL